MFVLCTVPVEESEVALVEGSAVTQTSTKLISDLFSFTHFLQARTNFTKLKASLREILKGAVVETSLEKVNEPNKCVEELLGVMRGVHWAAVKNRNRSDIPEDQTDSTGMKKYLEKEQFFRSMWNCGFSSVPKHVCHRAGPNPCCTSDDESRKKMADSMIGLAFSSAPPTPAPGKWTKLWEPLAFLVFTSQSKLLVPCFETVVTGFANSSGEIDPELDPALQVVLQWGKITGN